jgi:dihydroorotase/N-acyl-D-amino-acid deacylase
MRTIVAKIEAARRAGVDVAADTYAYPAWFNSLSAFVPPWAHDGGTAKLLERLREPATRRRIRREMETPGGGWDNEWQEIPGPQAVLIGAVQNPELVPLQGKTLAEVAKIRHADPIETLFDLLVADQGFTSVAVFGMSEADVTLALVQPWVSINNDSQGTAPDGILGQEHAHPRAYGTFPRILGHYVRDVHLFTLEEAVRKMTSLPAEHFRFARRGLLKEGYAADVAVFDPAAVADSATFEHPHAFAAGIPYVLVNGAVVVRNGQHTGGKPGEVLRGPGILTPRAARDTGRSERSGSRLQ